MDDFIFIRPDGTLPDPHHVSRVFKEIAIKAGLKPIRLHDLRHTHATLLLLAGIHPKIVSERLGHASIAITLDIYSHVLPGMQEAATITFDTMMAKASQNQNKRVDVRKMLEEGAGVECRPYRSRTCDTLIKSHGVLV